REEVEGDLMTRGVAMEQGAFFEGKSRRSDDPLSKNQTTQKSRCQLSHNRRAAISRGKRRRRKGRSCETCPNRTKFGSVGVLCVGGKHVGVEAANSYCGGTEDCG